MAKNKVATYYVSYFFTSKQGKTGYGSCFFKISNPTTFNFELCQKWLMENNNLQSKPIILNYKKMTQAEVKLNLTKE